MQISFDGFDRVVAGQNLTQEFSALHPMFQFNVPKVAEPIQKIMKAYSHFVLVGMGGSVLPMKVFIKAFNLDDRIHILDRLDPEYFQRILELPKALFCVASKSGETLEIKVLLDQILSAGRSKDLLIATDPQRGFLRSWVQANQIPSVEIPSDIEGRFTNFTVMHRALLEACGIDFEFLRRAALTQVNSLKKNSELLEKLYQSMFEARKSKLILWSYGEKWLGLMQWLQQILAESLGKKDKAGNSVGIFPIILQGPQDQHSVLQLLMDGPQDFCLWMFQEEVAAADLRSKDCRFEDLCGISPLGLQALFADAIHETFRERLTQAGSAGPLVRFKCKMDGQNLGELIGLFQALIEYSGKRLEINAFDQPGVERGKQIAKAMLKTLS